MLMLGGFDAHAVLSLNIIVLPLIPLQQYMENVYGILQWMKLSYGFLIYGFLWIN
jgi:hypothetical protein